MSWRSLASHSEDVPRVGTDPDPTATQFASRPTSAARRRPGEGDAPTTTMIDGASAITFLHAAVAERIRDKIAASKKKGMWMGGPPPLGFDVRDKRLVVNEAEAVVVRRLFDLYLQIRSVRRLKTAADDEGIVTKRRLLSGGRVQGGQPFSRGNLYQLLSNPIYIGEIAHKGQTYAGLHEAIVDRQTWDAVQAILSDNTVARRAPKNLSSPCILTGLVFDETGDRLTPSSA